MTATEYLQSRSTAHDWRFRTIKRVESELSGNDRVSARVHLSCGHSRLVPAGFPGAVGDQLRCWECQGG